MNRFRSSLYHALTALALLVGTALAACSDYVGPRPPGPPDPLTVSVGFCDALAPLWVAFQDGDGAWTRALPDERNGVATYRFDFTSDRGAIAVARTLLLEDQATALEVLYGAPEELVQMAKTNPLYCTGPELRTWRGAVAGVQDGDGVLVSAGFFNQKAVAPTPGAEFSLPGIPLGPQDLLASHTTTTAAGTALTGIILRRDLDIPDGGRLPDLDFGSAEAFAPANAQLTLVGGTIGVVGNVSLLTTNGAMVLDAPVGDPTATTRQYLAIPETRLRTGDVQHLQLFTDGGGHVGRSADVYFRATIDRTVTFGAQAETPQITADATSPSLRPRARFTTQADYDAFTFIVYEQTLNPTLIALAMTSTYAARSTSGYDLVVPDFSAVAGFDPTWSLQAGRTLSWSVERVGGNVPFGLNTAFVDGMHAERAFRSGAVSLP